MTAGLGLAQVLDQLASHLCQHTLRRLCSVRL